MKWTYFSSSWQAQGIDEISVQKVQKEVKCYLRDIDWHAVGSTAIGCCRERRGLI